MSDENFYFAFLIFVPVLFVGCGDEYSLNDSESLRSTKPYKARTETTSDQLRSELNQVWVSDVVLENEDFDVAFSFAIQKAASLSDNAPRVVPFRLNADVSPEIKISINAAHIEYTKLLDLLCDQAGLTWSIRDGTLVFDQRRRVVR